jgi:NAD(P)H-nitrite reductase large subunit
MKHVIVGCGIAGVTAAETIRQHDSSAEITMIADEPYYYRAALSFFLKKKIDELEIYAKPENWHKDFNIEMKHGIIISVDTQKKSVIFQNEEKINYDKLLIATGAKPFVAPWRGVELDGVCTYRSLDCVKRFSNHVKEGAKKAVVIGGGILGVELVDDFVQMGLDVTLIIREKQVLELLFDKTASDIIAKQMKCDGVKIRYETEAESFKGRNGKLTGVVLKGGEVIETDILGIAIGIAANIEFLKGSDIEVDRAVLVNDKLQTNIKDVFSAGDVCAIFDKSANRYRPTRTWLPCALQGEVAALNMLGQNKVYHEGIFFNASHAYRSLYAVLGKFNPDPSDEYEFVVCNQNEVNYEKLVLKENKIAGAMFIGSMKNVWPVKQLMEGQVDISSVRDKICTGTDLQLLIPNEHSILY